MLLAATGRGFTVELTFRGRRSSADSTSPVTGHFPVLSMYFSMTDCSKRWPVLLTTGCSGVLPDMAQNIAAAAPSGCATCGEPRGSSLMRPSAAGSACRRGEW
eukprot:scaffold122838_cov72-Phaeocystis_antarctica.AAC.1